ncbi:dsDNA nuclease domain-containing protein [Spirosoma rhododendri]|uniref:DUF4297 domain-containing protein n=1 Tax=Spirosoma rhododendri TaxID=2728024 RepID=A0A7L5DVY5_9BACT|nr:dsDNA nuclease domain-containing protein [Spirosoma rhododendri]QJD81621.1 DUF4297 domain-containing protein [Spirosoma rhododendri]
MSSLIKQLDQNDPGDATLRNFRYQFGYGVILLLSALRGERDYVSMWCEQHEDLICERSDSMFDCYQIKTSTPENGHLHLFTDSIKKTIKRFVTLHELFGDAIGNMYIVSNTSFLDTDQADKIARCPGRLLEVVKLTDSISTIEEPFLAAFDKLKNECECDGQSLLNTLKKVDLIIGPGRQSFETDIAQRHIVEIEGCENCTIPTAQNIVSDLILRIFQASSLRIYNPAEHLQSYFSRDETNPRLLEKRIFVEETRSIIKKHITGHFSYLPGSGSLVVADGNRDLTKLAKKLERGGLGDHTMTMQRRALATEQRLLELNTTKPEKLLQLIDQLESVVQAECDEALLEAKYSDGPMGEQMLLSVHKRLRHIADNDPAFVLNERYDTLIGFAGLLTGECKVWWSEKFDINQ